MIDSALAYLLPAQWADGLDVSTAWRTSVARARSVAEQRQSLVGRPSRSIQGPYLTFAPEQALSLKMLMARAATNKQVVPLYSDAALLTAGVASGATSLACDTTCRRFFTGHKVAVYTQDGATITAASLAKLATVADGSLTLDAALDQAFAAGSRVVPLIDAQVMVSSSANILTDRHMTASLTALEEIGPTALPGVVTPGDAPTGYTTHGGYPILELPHGVLTPAGSTHAMRREGGFSAAGLGQIGEFYGARGRADHTLPLVFLKRSNAWDFMRFFDSRAGMAYPWWLISPVADYTATAISAASVTVDAVGEADDWTVRPWVAVVLADGTVYVRGVDSVSRSGTSDTVTFDTALDAAPSLASVRRVCMAYLCRFASDELLEHWTTDGHMQATVEVVELLEEKTVTVGVTAPVTTGLTGAWVSGLPPAPCIVPTNMPPSVTVTGSLGDGHWLTEYWYFGQGGGTGSLDNILPVTMDYVDAAIPVGYGRQFDPTLPYLSTPNDKVVEDYDLTLHTKGPLSSGTGASSGMIYVNGYDADFFENNCVWIAYFGFFLWRTLTGNGNCYWVKKTGNSPVGKYELAAYCDIMVFTTQPSQFLTVS